MAPDEPMEAAVRVIAEQGTDALVSDGGRPIGVVRMIDLVRALAAGKQPGVAKVSEVMHSPPPVVMEGASLKEVAEVARTSEVRTVYVSDGTDIVGTVELDELFDLMSSSWGNVDAHKALAAIARVRIAELVSTKPMSVDQIAKEIGMKPITVRHHLTVLKAGGMVDTEQLRGRIGRPTTLFRGVGYFRRKQLP
ncbi:MAG: CBS domain-containing protein [Nitrososphaerota archaeon]|nr:CBS domain-containing protein [Nitrososphaerota archaeon]MDG6974734.1 CBS domain-containing protein [Nitrososphaerota archaeon]MDG7009997.1 CBS domain-containing protein [Nitrososphaerota archaeon]MDG7019002.1 CBS domain-containing protein [Nitrososphaerota archaeon]